VERSVVYFRIGVVVIELCLAGAIAGVLWQTMSEPVRNPSKPRASLGNALIYIAAFIFIASGASKLAHVPLAVEEMTLLGLSGGKYALVAAMEISCGLLLLAPRIRSLAALIVSAHMGGAICAHVIADQYFAVLPSMIILSLCWLGLFLSHPQMLWSFAGIAAAKATRAAPRTLGAAEVSQR
jgi:uncharacterized membrane protein YphA (DoxX/SURF4 family)